LFEVRQVDAAGRLALSAVRLRPPHTVVRKSLFKVEKADLRSELRGQSSEAVRSSPRTETRHPIRTMTKG
jgi:hypothetical protein